MMIVKFCSFNCQCLSVSCKINLNFQRLYRKSWIININI